MKLLRKFNILVRVDHSKWAPILKPESTVRICCDFKITTNPVLEGAEYPLSKI